MKPETFPSRQISISIHLSADKVYTFVSNPANLPKWAAGISNTIRQSGDDWISDSPVGEVKIHFVETNAFGVLDHFVTLPSGNTMYSPMRVIKNNQGSEVIFTLYRVSEMSAEDYEKDAHMIERDLRTLKAILEQ